MSLEEALNANTAALLAATAVNERLLESREAAVATIAAAAAQPDKKPRQSKAAAETPPAAGTTTETPPAAAADTKTTKPALTIDDLRTGFSGYLNAVNVGPDPSTAENVELRKPRLDKLRAMLDHFGVAKVTDIPANKWAETMFFLARLKADLPLNAVDFSTLYSPGEKGYTDYPVGLAA